MKTFTGRFVVGVFAWFLRITVLPFAFLIAKHSLTAAPAPIGLHPGNPHYFQWRGKPTIIITSGEHYGAVLNLDKQIPAA